jgi:hypothetical protein
MTRHTRIANRIHDLGGDDIAEDLVRLADTKLVHVKDVLDRRALACGLIQLESGFRNIYGHDGVRNPIKSPPGGVRVVTAANYAEYLKYRKAGYGMQGVGYSQLTYFSFQDRADKLGGCWKVVPNLTVAFEDLDALIRLHGVRDGLASYNAGEGNRHGRVGQHYATLVLTYYNAWKKVMK